MNVENDFEQKNDGNVASCFQGELVELVVLRFFHQVPKKNVKFQKVINAFDI